MKHCEALVVGGKLKMKQQLFYISIQSVVQKLQPFWQNNLWSGLGKGLLRTVLHCLVYLLPEICQGLKEVLN